MKKIIILLGTLAILNGCSALKEDIGNSYGNAIEEATEVADTINETKAKAVETLGDINEAVDEVKDAKNAIEEITD